MADELKPWIWVVEIKNPLNNLWEPTMGTRIARDDGRVVLKGWRKRNPSDKFRLVKYRRTP